MTHCLVKIPTDTGGHWEYPVEAASVFDAARQAIEAHERRKLPITDDTVVLVIRNGLPYMVHNAIEQNSVLPQWSVRARAVRR